MNRIDWRFVGERAAAFVFVLTLVLAATIPAGLLLT
jgi:hypothetical protein